MATTLTRKERDRFSVARMIGHLSEGALARGFEYEVCETITTERGGTFDPHRPVVPWEIFSRDVNAASSTGGALVSTANAPAVDALFAESAVMQAGVTVLPNLQANVTIPRISTAVDPVWLGDETTAITPAQPSLGSVALAPKAVAALVNYSKQLRTQVEALEPVLLTHLRKALARAIDKAVLQGTGGAGQPTGLSNVAGTISQAGASLAWAGVINMQQQVADTSAADSKIAFISTPSVRELLQTREQAAGSGLVWQGDTVAGRRAFASADCPTATMFAGDFSNIVLAQWGAGIELAVDAMTGFRTGVTSVRAIALVDVGVLQPQAFAKAASIT